MEDEANAERAIKGEKRVPFDPTSNRDNRRMIVELWMTVSGLAALPMTAAPEDGRAKRC
jgi:hypothetical protein